MVGYSSGIKLFICRTLAVAEVHSFIRLAYTLCWHRLWTNTWRWWWWFACCTV